MTKFSAKLQASIAAALMMGAQAAISHEFWIDPKDPSVESGAEIVADLRVGENMKGSGIIFNPNSFRYFAMTSPDGVTEMSGRMGDRPALTTTAGSDGLHIIGHMTTASKLTYTKFEKFADFVRTHGEDFAIDAHKARGLPETDFVEAYFRCAKALIKVGHGEGSDKALGFPFELIALDNPYQDSGSIRMQLTYKGVPKAAHQVDIFFKPADNGPVTMTSQTTDDAGVISVARSKGDYMINAVVLEEPSANLAERLNASWISLWASTTYTLE